MLRKISALLAALLCLGMMVACSQSGNDTTVTTKDTDEILSPITDYDEYDVNPYILGTFQCASSYYKDDYFLLNQESIPYIFFDEHGYCIMGINYLEGVCDIEGEYSIIGNEIDIKLDFTDSPFENIIKENINVFFLTDRYTFSILDDNTISIDHGCYSVNPGDIFVRIKD